MKIYSELTRQEYPTVEACLADEELFKKKKAEEEAKRKELAETRKARAKEVEDAYKNSVPVEDLELMPQSLAVVRSANNGAEETSFWMDNGAFKFLDA